MKQKTLFASTLIAILTAWSVQAAPAPSDGVDFKIMDSFIKSVFRDVLTGDDQINWALPQIDLAQSSVEHDRLSYSLKGQIKNAPWIPGGEARFFASNTFQVQHTKPISGVETEIKFKTTLDTISFIRYAGKVALTEFDSKIKKMDHQFEPRIRSLLEQSSRIQALSDFYPILLATKTLTVDVIENDLATDLNYLECLYQQKCGNVKIDEWGNHVSDELGVLATRLSITNLKRMQATYSAIQISLTPFQTLQIKNPSPAGMLAKSNHESNTEVKDIRVEFTPDTILGITHLFADVLEKDLKELHESYTKDFRRITHPDASYVQEWHDQLRTGVKAFKKAMNGHFVEPRNP